jgi:hypothetical protein
MKANTHQSHDKSKEFQAQLQVVFDTLYKKPATMLMVSVETGIMRACVCRHIDTLQKQNNIHLLRKEFAQSLNIVRLDFTQPTLC